MSELAVNPVVPDVAVTEFTTTPSREEPVISSTTAAGFVWYAPNTFTVKRRDVGTYRLLIQLDALQSVNDRLTHLLDLPANWDSYGAVPIRIDVAKQVARAIRDFMSLGVPAPQIVPTADGGLQLEWHQPDRYLEVHFATPTDLTYYLRAKDHEEEGSGDADRSRLATALASLVPGQPL